MGFLLWVLKEIVKKIKDHFYCEYATKAFVRGTSVPVCNYEEDGSCQQIST